ncbi:hypothetical protein ABIC22_004087 [Paenibacillus sp. PvP094]
MNGKKFVFLFTLLCGLCVGGFGALLLWILTLVSES